jgi:hypothetical protein
MLKKKTLSDISFDKFRRDDNVAQRNSGPE